MRDRSLIGALGLLVLAVAVDIAQAHEVRFVASNGSGNLCTRDAPCKTLQRGINRTPDGGELIILDSGDFGNSATIDKSITISAIGVTATLGGGITIDATDATVVLRGLRLNGSGSGTNGIDILTGATVGVYIEACEIEGFAFGISVNTAAFPMLTVAHSTVRNNSNTGLYFQTGTPGRLVVDNSRFEHNGGDGVEVREAEASIARTIASRNGASGIKVTFTGKANITETTAEHNNASGYQVDGSGEITLEQSVTRGNADGVAVSAGSGSTATARISSSVVTNNAVGLSVPGGGNATILTRGNNTVSGNTTNVSGTLTPLGGT